MSRFRSHLTYANVMATLTVFLAIEAESEVFELVLLDKRLISASI